MLVHAGGKAAHSCRKQKATLAKILVALVGSKDRASDSDVHPPLPPRHLHFQQSLVALKRDIRRCKLQRAGAPSGFLLWRSI